uniref:Pseudouridine 5'-phosphatase n=1 Tax=Haplochromis burtoni TaxID=8153 RepID=A0A3Q2W2A0_HAPBU
MSVSHGSYKPVDRVIFDMDGLLLDTERLYTVSFQEICDRFGKQYTWDVKTSVMGKKALDAAQMIRDRLQLPMTAEELLAESRQIQEKIFPSAKLIALHIHSHNHSHTGDGSYIVATATLGRTDRGETAGHWRHGPSDHHQIISLFFSSPVFAQCLVFEDAPNGVKAALAAGMQVVAIPDDNLDRSLIQEATLRLRSMEEFEPQLFGLPAYD